MNRNWKAKKTAGLVVSYDELISLAKSYHQKLGIDEKVMPNKKQLTLRGITKDRFYQALKHLEAASDIDFYFKNYENVLRWPKDAEQLYDYHIRAFKKITTQNVKIRKENSKRKNEAEIFRHSGSIRNTGSSILVFTEVA